ncbi:MAG: UDP-N-acetylglucosamine--N-acetylmuramyl-(pentapeptide) pyrophosphoryl-undecaprenol N-acetylglucosamine transferase (EC [uncultured Campylobacterales bacterium]|uniref:UDP-N-acetylglucosamine--N-acetylmuramyl-(pentapeptide) pyrophosphoryl-undecaprenol N-acetylglucosamine transferase n=1 Tax=uncultured Campylobacterales bacterium TaxID=352960 RepID=A0A6S6T254_9BACT|nr:MAG: UDP-N-acetylglucosamine--N-acetylmuramyl-(pentapeptide) pyrophosphoryl-undecaprenol N-acetylglucosamine transferase (EC [uncultured Campylobacterales bacterium]
MIVITGGGTGGHLSIAKSLKEELNTRGIKPIFIGSANGQDRLWFQNDDGFEEKYFFDVRGVTNKKYLGKIISLLKILYFSFKCLFIFRKHKIKKIVCVGGYSAAAASLASILGFKKLYIHEQNSKVGSLNKLLKPFAKEFFSSYITPSTPYPVAQKYFDIYRVRKNIKRVIFLGGSQGAKSINDFAIKLAPYLQLQDIDIIHQTGSRDFERIKKEYESLNIEVDIFAFSNELESKLQMSDFAVSRSGAGTMWELVASGVPTLFVPYPYASANHQYYNALDLFEKNLVFLMKDNELDVEVFKSYLKDDYIEISEKLKGILSNNGTKKIIDIILER